MSCPDAQALSKYYDDMLEGAERQHVCEHVTSCSACQHVLALYRKEEQFIRTTLQRRGLPAEFAEDVLREVRPQRNYKWLLFAWFVLLMALFIALVVYADVVHQLLTKFSHI